MVFRNGSTDLGTPYRLQLTRDGVLQVRTRLGNARVEMHGGCKVCIITDRFAMHCTTGNLEYPCNRFANPSGILLIAGFCSLITNLMNTEQAEAAARIHFPQPSTARQLIVTTNSLSMKLVIWFLSFLVGWSRARKIV
jgi:hypothetical protein